MTIPVSKWRWFGRSGHLCVGEWCRFHLSTQIGDYLVSTVGMWIPHSVAPNERIEATWRKTHPNGLEIGCDRCYETMVFKCIGPCKCGCGIPMTGDCCDEFFDGYNTQLEATQGHLRICKQVAKQKEISNGTL